MRTLVIINPASRKACVNRTKKIVRARLGVPWLDIETTAYCGHATTLAREAAESGYDAVVAVGGDGTVNEVLNGLVGSDTALGIIPTGTANDIAHQHCIPVDPERCCDMILENRTRDVDVISVNDWHFLTVGGIGLPCATLIRAESLKLSNSLGRTLARIAAGKLYLLALTGAYAREGWKGVNTTIRCNGWSFEKSTVSLLIGNQPKLGNQFMVLPGAEDDDGKLDVFAIIDIGRPLMTAETVARTINGSHVGRPDVRMLRLDSLDIETDRSVPFFGDGQIGAIGRVFNVRLLPRAVRLIVPTSPEVN